MDRTTRNATQQQQDQWTRSVSGQNAAMASEYFEQFVNASSLKHVLGYYRGIIDNLHLRPTVFTQFYPKLRANLTSWRAKALWKKFDARAAHKCYSKGRAAPNTRVLIIGGGPCGLRTAIEAQLLGAKVVLVEKRDRFSRNNVLHLWPFVIEDLRMLGAKKFFGKFCAGAIDHISIRQLQCILLKVALLLGVEVHTEVGFERLIEPQADEKIGWRAELDPPDHPVSQYEFDVIIGADGKRNTLQGFTRKEFRGKLAIAITANFINKKTEAEARVEEISGVAFIFNQKFFKELHETTRIDLENIVYYKDDTHYFVMTAKKASLLEKGVIKQDLADTEKLLAPDNVDRDALEQYAIEAANFSTNYQLPDLEFAVNHYGQPDIAMFDFTSMYAAENASKVLERNGHKLLMILVGDSLLEPFWPTGSGCARGFLSSLDAAWAIRGWGSSSRTSLDVIAERESVYRLLAQTTPDNLNKDWKSYTLDPATRYPNLNRVAVTARQVACLYDTDDPTSLERMLKRNAVEKASTESASKKRRRGNVDNEVLLTWLSKQLKSHEDIQLTDFASIFKDGNVLCAIIHHYRPDLLDYNTAKSEEPAIKNQLAFDILEKELGIPPVMTGQESISTEDYLTIATYLTEIYDTFRGEIPHIKHPKLPLIVTNDQKGCYENPYEITPECPEVPESLKDFKIECQKEKSSFENPIKINKVTYNDMQSQCEILGDSSYTDLYRNSYSPDHSKHLYEKTNEAQDYFQCGDSKESLIKNYGDNDIFHQLKYAKRENGIDRNRNFRRLRSTQDINQNSIVKLSGSGSLVKINVIEKKTRHKFTLQRIEYSASLNRLVITDKADLSDTSDTQLKNKSNAAFSTNLAKQPRCSTKSASKKYERHDYLRKVKTDKCRSKLGRSIRYSCQATQTVSYSDVSHCQSDDLLKRDSFRNFLSYKKRKMQAIDGISNEMFSRVSNWIKTNDFIEQKDGKKTTEGDGDAMTMVYTASRITDVTKASKIDPYSGIKVEERTDIVRCGNLERPVSSEEKFVEMVKNLKSTKPVRQLSKFSQYSPFASSTANLTASTPVQFSVIVETEEKESHQELPETTKMSAKLSDLNAKTIKTANIHPITSGQVSRPSSRHKRHAVMEPPPKQSSIDRKARKRKTLERVGASVEERQKILEEIATNRAERQNKRRQQRKFQTAQFIKSMQMLQSNAKPDSQPFEDYAIYLYRQNAPKFEDRVKDLEKQFTYVPSHYDSRGASQTGRATGTDDDLVARIKSLEDKWRDPQPVEKKPKDLLRAIGKIETSDWNIKEIEKKIMENKMGKPSKAIDKEKVPKWSKEQFLARQTKMERQHYNRQESGEAKYADIDKCIQKLDQKLKEGTTRDLGTKKVASIRDNLVSKVPTPKEPKRPEKSPSRTQMMLPTQSASEFCHFCNKRVYLMERLSAEGRFFHHGCFKCQYCHTQLRLGSYAFDRDGLYGYKFYCVHHFGMEGELPRVTRKPSLRLNVQAAKSPPDKGTLAGIANVDLLDRVQTPERVEFSNLSTGNASSIHEDSLSQMDEDEWTDRNFGASCAELGDSDDETSSDSDSEMDDEDEEDAYDDAMEDPEAKDGAAKWPDRWKHAYRRNSNDSDEYSSSDGSSYYENSSDDDESDTATEGEDEIRARELRRQEVQVEPPVVHTDTGTDTEIVSDESSSESSSEVQNSATEISTDSEFAQDDPTPTREILSIALNDIHVTKTRGSGNNGVPRKIQVTSGYIQRPGDGRGVPKRSDVELKLKPLVSPSKGVKPVLPLQGYALNRTQSTGGMAAKVSLELKKKYLLGDTGNSIQKSGSATALDSKFKSFQSNITDCQKLLKPAPEISNSMQTFCNIIAERKSPTYMTQHSSPSGLFPSLADSKQMKDGENEEKKMAAQNTSSNISESETNVYNEETEHLKNVIVENTETNEEPKNENVPEGRPRSPLHETSIIVPQIDWGKKNNVNVSSDSLNSSSDDDKIKVKRFGEIPTVTVEQAKEEAVDQDEEIPFDSLCHVTQRKKAKDENRDENKETSEEQTNLEKSEGKQKDEGEEELLDSLCIKNDMESKPVFAEAVNKNVSSEKKSLNQPKTLPNLASALPEIHKNLHLRNSKKDENSKDLEAEVTQKNSSGRSSPESMLDQPTALTDTELSDWARDGIVSDDLEFDDILADTKDNHARSGKDEKEKAIAKISETDIDKDKHKKDKPHIEKDDQNTEVNEAVNTPLCDKTISEAVNKSLLGSNFDNIAFMDTGLTESSSDADTDKHYSQGGYQLLRNDVESDFAEDSLNPCVNIEVVETRNEHVWSSGKKDDATQMEGKPKNTGYCYLTDDNEDPRENVSEATKSEMSKDDQNLLTVETGTTTEENTCSDSTVKVVTELSFDKENLPPVDNDKTPVAEIINSIAKDFKAAKDIDNRELTNVRLTKEIEAKDKDTKKVTNGDSGKSQAARSERRKSRKDENPVEFDERYQGLKSNVDFKNAKDSIDVRKARRRSKPDVMAGQPLQIQQKPDLIQEGSLPLIDSTAAKKKESMVLNLTPDILYRKNVIQKERDVNQRLVHEMVMNKMKTLEKKRRSKDRTSTGIAGNENMGLWRSKTATDLFAHRRSNLTDGKAGASTDGICDSPSSANVKTEAACSTPDVLLSTNIIPRLQSSKSAVDVKSSVSFLDKEINEYNNALKSLENADDKRPVSLFSTLLKESKPVDLVASMPEIFDAPKAPPRYNRSEDINRKLEKLKQNVKVRDKKREAGSYERHSWIEGSSEKDPRGSKSSLRKSSSKDGEDKKIHRRNSWLYSTTNIDNKSRSRKDVKGAAAGIEKMRRGSSESVLKVKRSKSFSEICDKDKGSANINVGKYTVVEIDADTVSKSDPNILEVGEQKAGEGEKQAGGKKKKDRERRKSITKMFATLFTRKSPTGASKKGGLFAKLSPKSKEVSKSLVNLSELRNSAEMEEKPISQKSLSETSIQRNLVTPPPIPPLPKNYHAVRMTDDSSDGELECRRLSSCDTLDRSGTFELSVPGARSSSKAMKAARQSQLKRLRLAQEIQRKLQETEVKTKELETKGVEVEKALRGECGNDCDCAGKDETELLREWFALMRDRQELRRYERELTDRAKELELEDRYHRLERDMRDRLSIENDIQTEVGI